MERHARIWLLVGLLVGYAGVARAGDQWSSRKGDCEDTFSGYKKAKLGDLERCTIIWETYKDVRGLNDAQRAFVAAPFMRLYYEGTPKQSRVAKDALKRIGIDAPKKIPKVRSILEDRPYNPKYNPPAPKGKGALKKAKALNGKGFKAYKKKDYDKALQFYLQAVKAHPGYETALYNAACMYGKKNNAKDATKYLWHLKDIGSKSALEYVNKARVDADFEPIRNTREFKAATGYVKLKLLNGLVDAGTEFGEAELKKLKKNLEKIKYSVADEGKDKHNRTFPIVFFKPEFKIQAVFFKDILNHNATSLVAIDWNTEYDIIISWGDTIKKDKDGNVVPPKPKVLEPEDFDKGLKKVSQKQDSYLKEPEKVAQKTDKILNKPVEYEKKVKSIIDRPSQTLDKLKNTKNKLEGLKKKIGF